MRNKEVLNDAKEEEKKEHENLLNKLRDQNSELKEQKEQWQREKDQLQREKDQLQREKEENRKEIEEMKKERDWITKNYWKRDREEQERRTWKERSFEGTIGITSENWMER